MPELSNFCSYHQLYCLDPSHGFDEPVRVKQPNPFGLCTQCYASQGKGKLPKYAIEAAPGVVPMTSGLLRGTEKPDAAAVEQAQDAEDTHAHTHAHPHKELTETSVCHWKPDDEKEKEKFGYRCTNLVVKNANSGKFVPFCAYHVRTCIAVHSNGTNDTVTIPNEHGLCLSHFVSTYSKQPPDLPFPFPGMDNPRLEKQRRMLQATHWAAPKEEPLEPYLARPYNEYEPPGDLFGMLLEKRRLVIYAWKKRFRGVQAATKIQALFRMYRMKRLHKKLLIEKRIEHRAFAATRIQALSRGRQFWKMVKDMRILYHKSVLLVQRIFRGNIVRSFIKEYKAACRLQKFMKKLHLFKLKDIVIVMMQLRTFFKIRNTNAVILQRMYRGFYVRLDIFRDKLMAFIEKRAIKRIIKLIYKHAVRIRKRKAVSHILILADSFL